MVIRVGLVGTGYAARARMKALKEDRRSHLIAISSRSGQRSQDLAQVHGLEAIEDWRSLVANEAVDLVVVATVSALHGEVVEAALRAGKHVIVEYPLSLKVDQAKCLVELATEKSLLLHVEHVELIGGLHQSMRAGLAELGEVRYVNYRTLNPQNPAPQKWTYNKNLFGFAYCGALSRVQRMVNLLGAVERVSCCTRYVGEGEDGGFKGVLSSARLEFVSGAVAELTYGKGEGLWLTRRDVEMQGTLGALEFKGNVGRLVTSTGERAIAVEPRKGLFMKDTAAVLSFLTKGTPLYVSAAESLYALIVADALRRASESGRTVAVDDWI